MKKYIVLLIAAFILPSAVVVAEAGIKVAVEVEVTKDENVAKHTQVFTYDKDRFRIDFPDSEKKITGLTPYIMTIDGGVSWVIGDKPKDKFYCSKMQVDEFFKNVGAQVTDATEFFNVTAEAPTVKKVFEQPGPEILGFKTTHLQLETNAKAHAWFLFFKFEYSAKIVDDIWYTTDIEIHPVRKKWINALSQSGSDIIDPLIEEFTSKLPGPVLKQESVVYITNVRKNETETQKSSESIVDVTEIGPAEMDEIFQLPECQTMDDKEVQEKARALFSAGKIIL